MSLKTGNDGQDGHIICVHSIFLRVMLEDSVCNYKYKLLLNKPEKRNKLQHDAANCELQYWE